jgi:hypothetical protein
MESITRVENERISCISLPKSGGKIKIRTENKAIIKEPITFFLDTWLSLFMMLIFYLVYVALTMHLEHNVVKS